MIITDSKVDVLPVHDHAVPGFVRLVSYMQPIPAAEAPGFDGYWSGDLEAVRNARVSFDADWRTGADEGADEKLINRLVSNFHTSPFEAMTFTFEVKAPIFIFRQWHRHRTWSYNEVSARYATLDEGFYVPVPGTYGVQSKNNKQVRDIAAAAFGVDVETAEKELRWEAEQSEHIRSGFALYKRHLDEGMARETARTVLSLASYSRMFATVDLHNLFHFLKLRLHSHSQYEIRVYAQAICELIKPIVPVSFSSFEQYILAPA